MSSTSNSFNLRTVAQLFKQELGDMLNAWEASKPLRVGAPHASSILEPGDKWCLRKLTLLALYPEYAVRPEAMPWDSRRNGIFLNGWALHEKYQKLFMEHGQALEVERSHYDEQRYLHFTPDAIIQLFGVPYIVEIKGYKQSSWEEMDEAGEPPLQAALQCNLYCHLLNIERGLLLIENKNTQEIKTWAIQHQPELAWPYTNRMEQVKGAVIRGKGKLPQRTCCSGPNDRRARECPVRAICFNDNI